jgi:hypothetical protein
MARGRRASVTPVSWDPAPEIRDRARTLIEQYHKHLEGQPIQYAWRSTAAKGKGGVSRRSRIVAIPKIALQLSENANWKHLDRLYIVEIPKSLWSRWGEDEQAASLDMCLSRLLAGDKGLQIVDLDIYDVARFIQRHGVFNDDVRNLLKSCAMQSQQLTLDEAPAGESAPPTKPNGGSKPRVVSGAPPPAAPEGGLLKDGGASAASPN